MIPIQAAPKRFVATLSKAQRNRSFIGGSVHARIGQSAAIQSLSLSSKRHSQMSQKKYGVRIESQFSIATCLRGFSSAPHLTGLENTQTGISQSEDSLRRSAFVDNLILTGERGDSWWTGKKPSECPGYGPDGRLYSLPQISFLDLTKGSVQDYFDNTWTLTEVLMASLQGDAAFTVPPYHELRHPMIFYYGHTASLYVNKLRVAGLLKDPIDPYFEVLFETGVDEMSWDDLSKNRMQWPTVAEVHAYRKKVYSRVSQLIESLSEKDLATVNQKSPLWALFMGFEHERIHLETSSVLITELPPAMVKFPRGFPEYHKSVTEKRGSDTSVLSPVKGVDYPINTFIDVEGQQVNLGKPKDYPSYGWDNEYGHRQYNVPAFRAAKYLTTNGEFYEFVVDGGYTKPELWTESGWKWRAFRNAKWPCFWIRSGPQGLHQFKLRLMFDVVPMVWDMPVSVNFHEAAAFAKWKSLKQPGSNYRVMTELEHHAIRNQSQRPSSPDVPSTVDRILTPDALGPKLLSHPSHGTNFNLACSSMNPVTSLPPNERGFHDVFGNAWHWTSDYFCSLPGFEVHPYYEDFSTPCFDGLHNVIMGGSFISTGNEASIFSRFHFRPHFFQHASFRLVEQVARIFPTSDTDAPGPYVGNYPFRRSTAGSDPDQEFSLLEKTDIAMSRHFGSVSAVFGVSEAASASYTFDAVVQNAARKSGVDLSISNIIEVGCGRGGLTFELATRCKSILGIDHDIDEISAARQIAKREGGTYSLRSDGTERDTKIFTLAPVTAEKLDFRCADPMCLPAELCGFDVVILNDVIDKVASPGSILSRLGGVRGLVRQGGLLVIISAFNWKESRTPKSLWLGSNNENAVATLGKRLSADFRGIEASEVPVFWQESVRDVRGKLYNVSLWKRI